MPKLGTSTDTYRCITIKVKRIRENGILGSKWSIYMTLPLSKLRNHRGRGGRNTVKSRDGNRRLKCVPVTKEQLHMGTTNRYNNIHKTHTNSSQRGEGGPHDVLPSVCNNCQLPAAGRRSLSLVVWSLGGWPPSHGFQQTQELMDSTN